MSTIIIPEEGHWLTQGSSDEDDNRFFSDMLILGCNDSADNYVQCTEEEKTQWEEAHPLEEPEVEEPEIEEGDEESGSSGESEDAGGESSGDSGNRYPWWWLNSK